MDVDCPCYIYIVHIIWTMPMKYKLNIFRKNCPRNIVIVHISWTMDMKYKNKNVFSSFKLCQICIKLFPWNSTHSFNLNFSRVPNELNSMCMGHTLIGQVHAQLISYVTLVVVPINDFFIGHIPYEPGFRNVIQMPWEFWL